MFGSWVATIARIPHLLGAGRTDAGEAIAIIVIGTQQMRLREASQSRASDSPMRGEGMKPELPRPRRRDTINGVTRRGFTGHEMLDSVGLVQMTKALGALWNCATAQARRARTGIVRVVGASTTQ